MEKLPADDALVARYLQPDKLVPITGKPLDLLIYQGQGIAEGPDGMTAKVLYEILVNWPHEVRQDGNGLGPRRFGVGLRQQVR